MSNISMLVEHFQYFGLFILLILGGIGFPFPEDVTLILCGFLISHDVVKPIPALLVVYSGLLIADLFLYLVGKKYGRQIVTHKRFQKIISPERLSMLEDKFNKKGILIILLGRHLIGLRAQIFLVAGVMRMSALKFLLADAVSSIFTIVLMVGAGYIGSNSLQVIKKDITRVEHIAMLGAVVFFAIYMTYRYFKGRNN
jgi:membrane protein DedA with SNARE-associated domain